MSSGHNDTNYASKGTCFGYFIAGFIIFIMLVVYLYGRNMDALQ